MHKCDYTFAMVVSEMVLISCKWRVLMNAHIQQSEAHVLLRPVISPARAASTWEAGSRRKGCKARAGPALFAADLGPELDLAPSLLVLC